MDLDAVGKAIADHIRPLLEKIATLERMNMDLASALALAKEDAAKEVADIRTCHAALRGEFDGITKGRDMMRGEKGDKGDAAELDVDVEGSEIVLRVKHADAVVEKRAAIPTVHGAPGEKGEPGERGEPGPPGRAADVGPVLQRVGALEQTAAALNAKHDMTQAMIPMLRGAPGEKGEPGKDGAGIAGLEVEQKDMRTYVYKFIRTDGEVIAAEICLPIPTHVGKWIPERDYKAADETSLHGCTWRAKKDAPAGEPGSSGDWTLIAKQGDRGEKGPPGPRGGIKV